MTAKEIAETIISVFESGNKLLCIGNGGSAEMCAHLCAEFVNKYKNYVIALPAIPLTNPAILTAIANDLSFEDVFSRQIEALGDNGDLLVVFSTSGKSPNCIKAIERANELGLKVLEWPREGNGVGDIQNNQLKTIHDVCEIVEAYYV